MSQTYIFTKEMGEISVFGGRYEQACQRMLQAGLRYFDENPKSDPKYHGYDGVYGIIFEDNNDAKALTKAVTEGETDCTGAMHQAVVSHCLFIKRKGWAEYVKQLTEREVKRKKWLKIPTKLPPTR